MLPSLMVALGSCLTTIKSFMSWINELILGLDLAPLVVLSMRARFMSRADLRLRVNLAVNLGAGRRVPRSASADEVGDFLAGGLDLGASVLASGMGSNISIWICGPDRCPEVEPVV